jgi:hypothetical protein
MTTELRTTLRVLAATLLLAAISAPLAVRLLLARGAVVNNAFYITALAGNLTAVLLLALTVGLGGYFLTRPAPREQPAIERVAPRGTRRNASSTRR